MARKRRTDTPSRGEVTEKIDKSKDDMTDKTGQMDTISTDNVTVTETLDGLDLSGTAEGSEAVEASIEQAQDVTVEKYDEQEKALQEDLDESLEHETDLQERSDATESDLDKVSDAVGNITTEETKSELEQAKSEIQGDIDFLTEHDETAREAREENEQLQQEYRSRMQSSGR
jgi:hypothetical protein